VLKRSSRQDENAARVFATAFDQYAVQAFDVNAVVTCSSRLTRRHRQRNCASAKMLETQPSPRAAEQLVSQLAQRNEFFAAGEKYS